MVITIDDKLKGITEKIRDAREQLEYTQEYLAVKLGISQNAYSKIELGYTVLTVKRLFSIALILDADVNELMTA